MHKYGNLNRIILYYFYIIRDSVYKMESDPKDQEQTNAMQQFIDNNKVIVRFS